jgi:tetratricopeptide (TPR) repeat protein
MQPTMPASRLSPLLQQGMAASQRGDSSGALAMFAQATLEEPTSGVAYLLMGAEHASLGQIEQAEAAFANAVLLAPALAIARYQLGLLQFSSGRAALALITWQPLLALGEDSPFSHFVRGFAALAQDDFGQARSWFEAGLQRNTDNAPLSADIQKVLRDMDAALVQTGENTGSSTIDQATDDQAASHVLLSNYQQQGPAH